MIKYSPYDNVAAKNYPAMLIQVSLNDSQVRTGRHKVRSQASGDEDGPERAAAQRNMGAGHAARRAVTMRCTRRRSLIHSCSGKWYNEIDIQMKKALKWIGISLVVLLVVSQAIRPAKTNPAVDETQTMQANTHMSPEVAMILERACANCHSSRTTWPWYSQVAPVSWFIVSDVNGAAGSSRCLIGVRTNPRRSEQASGDMRTGRAG